MRGYGLSRRATGAGALAALLWWGCGEQHPPMPDSGASDGGGRPSQQDGSAPDAASAPDDPAEAMDAAVADAAAGEGGATEVSDAGILRLVSRVPEPDAGDVGARDPVVLEFSAPLDPAAVTGSTIRLESAGRPLEAELQLSADGRQVQILPQAVPMEPARVTAVVSDALSGVMGQKFAGDRWSWTLPLWHQAASLESGPGAALAASLAVDTDDRVLVAWIAGDEMPVLRLVRLQDQSSDLLAEVSLDAAAQSGRGHAVQVDENGAVFVASIEQDSVVVRELRQGALHPAVLPWTSSRSIESCDLALVDGVPVLAVVEGQGDERDARVLRYEPEQASWGPVGPALDRVPSHAASHAVLAAAGEGSDLGVAWLEHDGVSKNLYVARLAPGAQSFAPLGGAVDLELDADVREPRLALGPGGVLSVLWNEGPEAQPAAYVARVDPRVVVLGGALDPARASFVRGLALDARGEPLALLQNGLQDDAATPQLSVLRYNGSPAPPFGLQRRADASCSLPADDDPAFPQTLGATGCFEDVASRSPAPGTIPYSVNAPLWSDGALKRRYLVVPDGQTLDYRDEDAWGLPVGSVLVKEFLLQRSADDLLDVVPMETRLLVKRCEPGGCRAPFQGYSYQWNEAGTEAVLLDNTGETLFKDWAVGERVHRHSYPGRDECMRCHATAAGGALGLQTGQLNRNHDYGPHVDNQIRALGHIGLFGASLPEQDEAAIATMPRLPSAYDPAEALEARARAYMHANCSHCHRPDGRWPVVDLRFDAALRAADDESPNLCDKLVPGDASASLLYLKLGARPPDLPAGFQGDPMPPLATLVPDARQLPVFSAWIDGMQSCP